MKQLVNKDSLTGWRKPSKSEVRSIEFFVKELKTEMVYFNFWSILVCGVGFIIIKFGTNLLFESKLKNFITILFICACIVIMMIANSTEVIKIYHIVNDIKTNNYMIELCCINKVEHKLKGNNLSFKRDILAYIHNEFGEYCMEPIIITEDIEESANFEKETKFILLRTQSGVYKVLDIVG